MCGEIEFGKCDFCKEEKPVWRTYLYPSKYQKPELFEQRRILHNQGDYFIYLSTCNDCGDPVTYEQKNKQND